MQNNTPSQEFRKRLVRDIAIAEKVQLQYKNDILKAVHWFEFERIAQRLLSMSIYISAMNDCLILFDQTIGEFDNA